MRIAQNFDSLSLSLSLAGSTCDRDHIKKKTDIELSQFKEREIRKLTHDMLFSPYCASIIS